MITDRVTYEQLLGISGCLGLALLAHITTLPLWVPAIVVGCGIVRLSLARSGRGAPPGSMLVFLAVLAVPLLLVRFHTFNGLAAGTALLSVTAGLKLLETKTRRDIYIITLIIYFVSLAALLEGDSFWLLAYLIGVCWLTTATLLRSTSSGAAPDWRRSLRYGGSVLVQALPLALVFWLLFPRFAGPLWHIPGDSQTAASGLSDTMSPGDITQLALSDEVAFRARFRSGNAAESRALLARAGARCIRRPYLVAVAVLAGGARLEAARTGLQIYGHDGAASASVDIHARLAEQLESAARGIERRLHLDAVRTLVAPRRCGRHFVYQCSVDAASERPNAQPRS